jgi:hypothetical protein
MNGAMDSINKIIEGAQITMATETVKILVPYLGKEVEVEMYDSGDADGPRKLYAHSSLEDIINNECPGVSTHYTWIPLNEPNHYAAFCTIHDEKGRHIEGIGESKDSTLDTQISKKYPVQMAVKRAFDDAAITFLRLGNVYSDNHITPNEENSETKKAVKAEVPAKKAPAEPVPAAETKSAAEAKPATGAKTVAGTKTPKPVDMDEPESEPAAKTVEKKPEAAPKTEPETDEPNATGTPDEADDEPAGDASPFGIVVTVGRRKSNGWTIEELAKNDIDSLKWVANTLTARDDNQKKQKEAAILWLKENGVEDVA